MSKEGRHGIGRFDPRIAPRIAVVGGIFAEELPKPRIEGIAQITHDKLVELRSDLDKDYLEKGPNGDVLSDAYDNFLFLRDSVFPVLTNLMERTTAGINLGKNTGIGCRYLSDKEGGVNQVELEVFTGFTDDVDDDFDSDYPRIRSIEDIQNFWDQGDKSMRRSLRNFAAKSKNKLLKYIDKYVNEYL